jgi:hypothetical protein
MPSIPKRGLAQAALFLEAEAAVESYGALVALFDTNADPVYSPSSEAGLEDSLHHVHAEPLTPVVGVDDKRELDGPGFWPVDAHDDQSNGVTRKRFGDERLRPIEHRLPCEPVLDLTRHMLNRASRCTPAPAIHHDRVIEPMVDQGHIVTFDGAQIDRLTRDHRRLVTALALLAQIGNELKAPRFPTRDPCGRSCRHPRRASAR